MSLIKKAELIERMKSGEILTRFHHWNSPDSFHLKFHSKNSERVHAGAARSLINNHQVKQTKYTYIESEYVWKGE